MQPFLADDQALHLRVRPVRHALRRSTTVRQTLGGCRPTGGGVPEASYVEVRALVTGQHLAHGDLGKKESLV